MRLTRIAAALLALGVFSVWGNGYAADKVDYGKREFQLHCSVCHGWEGKGDGLYATHGVIKTKVPDLTTLSKKNNGVFPFRRVYEVIDGTEALTAHGTREMPIWGPRYRADIEEAYFDVPFNPEAYVRAHILALIDYINRLQGK
jgi:mono/diheme cytochrome c family protein